jgi:hypothetical protein
MDRTSSSHNLRTTDTSQDDSINTNQTQNEKPSGIVSLKYQSITSSLNSTKPLTSTEHPKRAPNTNVRINHAKLENQQILHSDRPFFEIQEKTRPFYNVLCDFERSVHTYHNKYDETQKDDDLKKAWGEFKITRDVLSKPENSSDEKASYKEKY